MTVQPPRTSPPAASRVAPARPAALLLRTAAGCDVDPGRLLEVFGEQRDRFTAILHGFGPGDWAAPTRCADWSAHEVVRHLSDANAIGIAAHPDDGTLDNAAGFDPRTSPRDWLAASAGESPGDTLRRFETTTGELLDLARGWLARGRRFDVRLPYGPMDWTVLVLHAFWDSWIHERDVLLARGAPHPTDDDATAYATAYGAFIAGAVASMFGDPVRQRLELSGEGGGVFELDSHGGVTLTVRRAATARPAAAGPAAAEVADALAGRSPAGAVLGALPAGPRAALSHLAQFFNTPAG